MSTEFSYWLFTAMEGRGLNQSQVAAYLDVHPSSVNAWIRDTSTPSPANCAKLATLFGEPLGKVYAMAGHPNPDSYVPEERAPKMLREHASEFLAELPLEIPIHEQTASGGPGDEVIDYVYWARPRAAGRDIVGMRVRGTSMEPDVRDGDVVIIDKGMAAQAGDLVAATVDGKLFVKRLEQLGAKLVLRGNNGTKVDLDNAQIEGVVIQLERELRR